MMLKPLLILLQTQCYLQDVEKLLQENTSLNSKIHQLEISLEEAQKKLQWFEEQMKLNRQRQFGKRSEVLLPGVQQELIFDGVEADPEVEEIKTPEETTVASYKRNKKTGRRLDTSQLPRRQEIHDLADHEKRCKDCGEELTKFRDDISEQIEIIPRQLYVVEHVCPQYACRHCVTVQAATKPFAPVPKCMAGASLITEVILSKYEYHLPLYRQSKILKGLALDIPDNTLGNWIMQAGEGLRPLGKAFGEEILAALYLQVDETPVKVLHPEKKAYMWGYLSPLPGHKLMWFRFSLSRSSEVVNADLKDFAGLLQNDGYQGYNGIRKRPNVTPFGCIAHSRRKFMDVVKIATPKSANKAQEALTYFAALYQIENEAKEQQCSFEERRLLRQTKALPILDKFYRWLVDIKNQVPPESAIGKAVNYTVTQWPFLKAYVDYGEVAIDTNWVENQNRPFALGRRNWLFVSHEKSAQIAALYYSLIQSAKLNELNPRTYIHYLLTQVHALRKNEVNARDLLPHRIDKKLLEQFAEQEIMKAKIIYS